MQDLSIKFVVALIDLNSYSLIFAAIFEAIRIISLLLFLTVRYISG